MKDAVGNYSKTETKTDRTAILSKIVDTIRSKGGTGFVKQEKSMGGEWIEVGDLLAREKAAQMMRNALSSMYRSSLSNKKQRRKNVDAKRADNLYELMATNKHIELSMVTLREGIFHGRGLSDEELIAFFTHEQCNILENIKADISLVESFCRAEASASLMTNNLDDNDTDSDSDMQMTNL